MTSTDITGKPFKIEKRQVYEAYKAVKSNKGAAGVDGQTLDQFDADLEGNLYKIWNRMSSGSYFPPAVRAVAIPKKSGGERILGVPTVSTNCTGPQYGFGMGGDPTSVSSASRPALRSTEEAPHSGR